MTNEKKFRKQLLLAVRSVRENSRNCRNTDFKVEVMNVHQLQWHIQIRTVVQTRDFDVFVKQKESFFSCRWFSSPCKIINIAKRQLELWSRCCKMGLKQLSIIRDCARLTEIFCKNCVYHWRLNAQNKYELFMYMYHFSFLSTILTVVGPFSYHLGPRLVLWIVAWVLGISHRLLSVINIFKEQCLSSHRIDLNQISPEASIGWEYRLHLTGLVIWQRWPPYQYGKIFKNFHRQYLWQ